MQKFNYKMLILAREFRGLTQTELANNTKTDQGYLSKIEQGLLKPSDETLELYAKKLNFPVSFFYEEGNKTVLSDFFYRKRMSLPAKEKIKIEAEIEVLRFIYTKLLKSVDIPEPKIPAVAINQNFTPQDAAMVAREYYKIPKGALRDIISILEKNGITILFIDVDNNKFDGMTAFTDSNYPIIVLNKNMPNDRKKFTIAHELGHQIMHFPHKYDFELYDRLNTDSLALEKEADMFAAEFLLPERECCRDLRELKYNDLSQLKLYWQVSKKALIYRAKSINAIDANRYKYLLIELSRQGERITEDFDVFLEEPKMLKQIFDAYFTSLKFSTDELSKFLSFSVEDLEWLMNQHNGSKLKIVV